MSSGTVTINRAKCYPWPSRRGPAWHWVYDCVGPDGTRFDNRSIVELRRVLKRHYGRDVVVVEPSKAGAP